jgi:uncharacterized protein
MNNKIIEEISKELMISIKQVEATLKLLEEGNTIPFIARYRKEVTGNLNEDELRLIESEYNYAVNLASRKEDVKRLIDEKGMLTPEIEKAILEAKKLSEVEDIYTPFKEKRKTKGTEAIKMGLEPLAKIIMSLPNKTRDEIAKDFLNEQVKTIDDAMTNAGYIIADWISDRPKYRKYVRNHYFYNGKVVGKVKKGAEDPNKVYEIYYNFECPIPKIKPHQTLALARADKEKVITYSLSVDAKPIIEYLEGEVIGGKSSPLVADMKLFIEDAWKRLMEPSLERDIKAELYDKASEFGVKEFGNNLENLLLTPPIKECVVMGFDPAFRTGCKLAVLSPTGAVLEIGVIYPHEPKKEVDMAEKIMLALIQKHGVKVIAIGNGTASRESEKLVSETIHDIGHCKYAIVSEACASVYSASPLAISEFPDLTVEKRSAISIARRLQDPLNELVKIDPKSIGVGQYQHDVSQKKLSDSLDFTVSNCVNKVGVNINTASPSILKYISGLTKTAIEKIIKYREENGKIKSREELKKKKLLNDKAYEQSIGFMRVIDGDNPLDETNIHTESYDKTLKLLSYINMTTKDLGTKELASKLDELDLNKVSKDLDIDMYTLNDIVDSLKQPNRDFRDDYEMPLLKSDILTIDNLTNGMKLEGTVRNVVDFGAFIDIGLHSDGLVHLSKITKKLIKHPSEVLSVGDIVTCYVIDINKEKEKVSLSLIDPNE